MLKRIAGKIWRKLPRKARLAAIRSTQVKFTVSVGACIYNEEGKVLLLDHVLRPSSGWGIPGGFIERGEQPEAAIMREIREETGLELENLKMVLARTVSNHVEILFTARGIGDPKVMSREIQGFGWFELSSLPPGISKTQKMLIEKISAI